jgi:drug/metabolite transporter (DMT)-like permease
MINPRIAVLTALALTAFAGNSLLCRAALAHTGIDPASFTTLRLLSGAVVLWLIVLMRGGARVGGGSWLSASALFAYAAGFSFAYVHLSAAAGALILFGAVQMTMIGHGIWSGERLSKTQIAGLLLACGGLLALLLPGLSAPPLASALLMLGAGIAWGIYSLRGKYAGDPMKVTAGNFLRATPIALGLSLLLSGSAALDASGILYAMLSGALASGVGYAIWYAALPALKSTSAASLQLSVPVLAALGGIAFLGETMSVRLILSSAAVIGGIGLAVLAATRSDERDSS